MGVGFRLQPSAEIYSFRRWGLANGQPLFPSIVIAAGNDRNIVIHRLINQSIGLINSTGSETARLEWRTQDETLLRRVNQVIN